MWGEKKRLGCSFFSRFAQESLNPVTSTAVLATMSPVQQRNVLGLHLSCGVHTPGSELETDVSVLTLLQVPQVLQHWGTHAECTEHMWTAPGIKNDSLTFPRQELLSWSFVCIFVHDIPVSDTLSFLSLLCLMHPSTPLTNQSLEERDSQSGWLACSWPPQTCCNSHILLESFSSISLFSHCMGQTLNLFLLEVHTQWCSGLTPLCCAFRNHSWCGYRNGPWVCCLQGKQVPHPPF